MDSEKSATPEISPVLKLPNEMLEKVLQLLPFRDLLACREVSKKWKSVATDSVRKRCAPLSFSREDITQSQRSRALGSFTQLIKSTDQQGEFPVTEFRLDLNSDYYWIQMDGSTLIAQFLEAVNPFVKHIVFDFDKKSLQVPNHCLAIPQDLTFPNLTEISLMVFQHQKKDSKTFSFARKVIKKCPNIKEIYIHLYNITRDGAIRRCIVETGIKQKASLVTLLFMDAPRMQRDFEYLTKPGFKLKNFRLNLSDQYLDKEIFKKFIQGQSYSLTTLTVCYGNSNNFRELPCLPHLKNLSILSLIKEEGEEQFPTLFFKSQLPALKKLDLKHAEFAVGSFMAGHVAPSESLRELILPFKGIEDAGAVIREAARLFPNLNKLQLSDENGGLFMSHIYEAWPRIEELCIWTRGRGNVDDIITGLPEKILYFIGKEVPPPSHYLSKGLAMLERGATKSLACLENLKILKIYRGDDGVLVYKDLPRREDFTEISGVVFKQMKSLQCIDFGVRKYGPSVSTDLQEDLEAHGIKLFYRRPRFIRLRTDFIESDDADSD